MLKQFTTTRRQESKPYKWRDRLSALQYVPPMLKLVWETHRVYTTLLIAFRLLRSLIPVAFLWVGKLIIDMIVAAQAGHGDYRRLQQLIVLEIAITIGRDLLSRASDLIERLLADLFNQHSSVRLMEHAALLDLRHFEDPLFYDQLELARNQTSSGLGVLARLLSLAQDMVTLLSLAAALCVHSPVLLLFLIVTVFPTFFGESYFARLEYFLFHHLAGLRRHLDYLRYVGASAATAKEVQLFGLAPWLVSWFRRLSQLIYRENKRLFIRKGAVISAISMIGTFGYYAAYAVILNRAYYGKITLGTLTFLAGSFTRVRDLINLQMMGASSLFSQALFLKDLFDFFEIKPTITSPKKAFPMPEPIREGIVFDNVSFRYPGADIWAVRNLSFILRPGERIAFVGENGAGKTTVVKLLARLYDPTEGRLLIDGRDAREYDLQSLRRAIGTIFQDFVRYDWRLDENIGIGQIEDVRPYLESFEPTVSVNGNNGFRPKKADKKIENPPPIPAAIVSAAEKSLASMLLPHLVNGYRQMLGRRFDGGVDLSGGEWQKVALARAYMRDAQIFILDEPTAALDARTEYEVFNKFSELVVGKTTLIISHRFSTVRMADRIIVLQNGRIKEEGTHNELVKAAGLYAELFALQAEGYH
jgi:ATP-binding cassette, subfamily B, bacterial